MRTAKLATDPLWQCLCSSWSQTAPLRTPRSVANIRRPALKHFHERPSGVLQQRRNATTQAQVTNERENDTDAWAPVIRYEAREASPRAQAAHNREHALHAYRQQTPTPLSDSTPYLYTRLRALAIGSKTSEVCELAEYLVRTRKERPNVQLYSALILSNTSYDHGAAWRVAEYLDEMKQCGLEMDIGCCQAVLKVLAVHPDHLLRAGVLEYMRNRWWQVNEEGAHDVTAGLLREGLFEQALNRIDEMRRDGIQVQGWLLDMAVYVLCAAGEVEEAYRIMWQRYDGGELQLSRTVWYTLLDTGSSRRHHASTSLIWNSQVNTGYINPSSGICLNVLITASQAGDSVLATDVFSHLSKRGTAFQAIHYQMLIECYLASSDGPDLNRALSILTIMASERLEPTNAETRAIFSHIRQKPILCDELFATLRELHDQNRRIPIAALNLLIEAYIRQHNLSEALKVYKLLHTFAPPDSRKTFANIETFNLLLRGCRVSNPPDAGLASFLVSELLALRVKPTALTYDRLMLVFLEAGKHHLELSTASDDPADSSAHRKKGGELIDWAYRHFTDIQAVSSTLPSSADSPADLAHASEAKLGWLPRFGTLERLATSLAKVGDARCWDVLQVGSDAGEAGLEGWDAKGMWARRNVEKAWAESQSSGEGRSEAGEGSA